ncbi:MAG: hypothetical protein ACK6DM_01465 [Alphaproteobacteria bacterium]
MKRVAAAVLAGFLFVSPAPAMFAMVPAERVDEVPVERLLANLERNAQKLSEAERWRADGRVRPTYDWQLRPEVLVAGN